MRWFIPSLGLRDERARQSVSMQGPDGNRWGCICHLARHFYTRMLPEHERLIGKARAPGDPEKARAADALHVK
jgi:hypothetical protein